MTPATQTLTERLLSSFPSGNYCLPALLQLAEIVETTDVPTAAVECTMRPRLLLNPQWVDRHAQTPEKLVMLVMHELHHVILGHTRLFPRATPLDNLVFDAVINSMLCHLFPARANRALMTDFYSDEKFPECFLRPPLEWKPLGRVETPRALQDGPRAHLAPLYARLYSRRGATYSELRDALRGTTSDAEMPTELLLGDHRNEALGASSAGSLEIRSPALLAEIRRIAERWPRPPKPIIGRTVHAAMEAARLRVPPPAPRGQLVSLLRRIARRRMTAGPRTPAWRPGEGEGPVLRIDRRTTVLRSLGMKPLLQRTPIEARRMHRAGERVHVYLDVSGSVNAVVPSLIRAILDCGEAVHPVVHLFSTEVADVTLDELRAGNIRSTYGTSIECVAQHLDAHRIRRAVLVTDGFVGAPSARARATLETRTLGVALTPSGHTRHDLDGLVAHWTTLNPPTA